MISGALIHISYSLLDLAVLGELAPFTIAMRFLSLPFLLALFLLTFTEVGRERMQTITVAIVLIVTVSFATIIQAIGQASPPYYVGLIHLGVTFSAVARLNFRVCSALLVLMIAVLFIATKDFPNGPDLLAGQALVASIFLSCAMGNYFLERNRRLEFITYRDKERFYARVSQLAADAERSVQRKNALLNVLGHVVKTPLHQIVGYAQIIEQSSELPGASEEIPGFAAEINRAGQVLSHQSQRILDYSRADAGLLPSTPQRTTPARMVREAVYRFEERAKEKCITLDIDVAETAVCVDNRHLTRALDEVLENAVRYCQPGNTITLRTRHTMQGVTLTVTDNGPGAADIGLKAIEDAFDRIEDFRKMGGDKLGIGLSLARILTSIAGGQFFFASIPGHGSQAEFVLPLAQENVTPFPTSPNEDGDAKGGRQLKLAWSA